MEFRRWKAAGASGKRGRVGEGLREAGESGGEMMVEILEVDGPVLGIPPRRGEGERDE